MIKKRVNLDKLKKVYFNFKLYYHSCKPKSCLSPLQLELAAFVYKKYGSRKLIDVLSSLGFCSSYTEAVHFEVPASMCT